MGTLPGARDPRNAMVMIAIGEAIKQLGGELVLDESTAMNDVPEIEAQFDLKTRTYRYKIKRPHGLSG